MTLEQKIDALCDALDEQFLALNGRLDAIEKKRTEDNAGLRLELNQLRESQAAQHERQVAILRTVAHGVANISAEQVRLREGVSDQIAHEVERALDENLPFTARAAANGTLERKR